MFDDMAEEGGWTSSELEPRGDLGCDSCQNEGICRNVFGQGVNDAVVTMPVADNRLW